MDEILRDIEGFEGLYMVSDQGNVYNVKRKTIVKPSSYDKPKHLKVLLYKNGKRRNYKVHRLVAKAFPEICGEWFEGCEVNHLNEKAWDNRAINLRTCDRLTNVRWGTGIERSSINSSKPIARYSLDGKLMGIFLNARIAALMTGADYKMISACCHGKRKTHHDSRWAFIDLQL